MARLEPFFPKSHGKPRVDDRRVLSGIIFVNRNGLRWRDAPAAYGLLVRQKTTLISAIRSHCAEFGLVAPQGARRVFDLLNLMRKASSSSLPEAAVVTMEMLGAQMEALALQVRTLERGLLAWHGENQTSQRLATIPGVGIITSTAFAASISDPSLFRSGRGVRGLSGFGPSAELVRRQRSPGSDIQEGRRLSAQAVGSRSDVGDPPRANRSDALRRLGSIVA
jgi:transposase